MFVTVIALKYASVGKSVSLKTRNQVWYCQSTKAKVTLWSVDLIEGLNCWNML